MNNVTESVAVVAAGDRPERELIRVINMADTRDGDGVKIKRIAGQAYNVMLDPFLMIDEIRADEASDYIGGFPSHPHRGFETITYMLDGCLRHRDHLGNEGLIKPGGVQWMTAGRGIIHSEMPEQDKGRMHGFQLWVNLPSEHKMSDPKWRDIQADELACRGFANGIVATVLGGILRIKDNTVDAGSNTIRQLAGPIRTLTDITLADILLPPQQQLQLLTMPKHTALVLVFDGELDKLSTGQLGVFGPGSEVRLKTNHQPARILFLAGAPLREPVVQYGPFVMNTRAEIDAAISDYQHNRF